MNAVVLGLLEREWQAQSGRDVPFAITSRVTEVLELAYGGAVHDLPDATTPAGLLAALGPAVPSPWALRVLTALSALDRSTPAPPATALARTDPPPAPPAQPDRPAAPVPRPRVRLSRLLGAHVLAGGAGFGLAAAWGDSPVLLGVLAAVAGAWAALLVPARKPGPWSVPR
ncbi:hypothetical protein [Nonomuraea sp. NPDC050643]|uniref:hypothetical protein n=1 Tax=Nonomuraea sp. NPDC050643 TaxID=3155660 RepID=UPI0033E102EE